MGNERILVPLDDLGSIRAHGPDVRSFLQGQLSNDVSRLTPERSLLAGYHNPQGRTIALLRLLWLGEKDVLAVLPRELAAPVAMRLARFVLRAKVKVADESSIWRARGVIGPQMPGAVPVGHSPTRGLIVSPSSDPTDGDRHQWHRLDIEAGQPQVFAATSEEFVAQMLNLDALDAIAFDKGCYTGQEVIARAHYRGRVKRRLQRFVSRGPATLAPGQGGTLYDGRAFKVVDAVRLEDGRCEFLAVAPLVHGKEPEASPAAETPPLEAQSLPLPYPLPD
jgi:tRNA-modifying protein YgfZ